MPYIGLLHWLADHYKEEKGMLCFVSMPYIGLLHNSVYRISTTIIPQNLQKSINFPKKSGSIDFFVQM